MEKAKQQEQDMDKLFEELIDYFTRVERTTLNRVNRELADKSELLQKAAVYLLNRKVPHDMIDDLICKFHDYVFGYHILEPLINDEMISDIKVMKYDNVRAKKKGDRIDSGVKFKNEADLQRFAEYVAIKNKVSISDNNALPNFTDKLSNPKFILRFSMSTPYVNSVDNFYIQIRKVSKEKRGMDYLVAEGMLDEKTVNYLIDKVKNANGILFTGKGASGKTTLMNELLEHIPLNKSGEVIQENEELFTTKHPEITFHHIVRNCGEGKIQYTLEDLARMGLMFDLDYFIIGEIKGGEAVHFLNAAYTGHKCWASVHGVSSTEAIDKLADYALHASNYSKPELMKMLRTMEVVVFMENFKVKEISEVVGFDETTQRLIYKRIL